MLEVEEDKVYQSLKIDADEMVLPPKGNMEGDTFSRVVAVYVYTVDSRWRNCAGKEHHSMTNGIFG